MSSRKGSRFDRLRTTRIIAMQAVFQMQARTQTAQEVIEEFTLSPLAFKEAPHMVKMEFFKTLVHESFLRRDQVNQLLTQFLSEDWPYARLDSVLVALLKVAITELLTRPEAVPIPVIITEYVHMAQGFVSTKEAAFVNAHLDKVARALDLLPA